MELLGVALGLVAAVFWGSYLVPVRKFKTPEGEFTLSMALGLGIVVIAGLPWLLDLIDNPKDLLYSMSAGLIWSIGNICSLYAVRGLGLSRAVPVFSIAVVVNAIYGITIFGEFASNGSKIALLFAGIAVLMVGVVLAVSTERLTKKGKMSILGLALFTGIMFGTYNAPIRATTVDPSTATVGVFLGMVISSIFISIILMSSEVRSGKVQKGGAHRGRRMLVGMISGVMWGVGTAFSVYTIRMVGLAVSFPIFQVNVLIYAAWGLFYFKEVSKDNYWKIILGGVLVFLGAVIVVVI